MDVQAKTDNFVAQYNGQYIDEDKWYGSQCWDLVARYAREVWGCPTFPTGSGGAEGLYRLAVGPILEYFDRIPGKDLQPGDIAVCDSTFYPPWGHTFLVWKREGNTVWAFEQDGSNDPNGDDVADGVAYLVQRTITSKMNGLRPKGASEDMNANNYVVQALAEGFLNRTAANDKNLQNNIGLPVEQVIDNFRTYPEAKARMAKANDYDRLKVERDALEARVKALEAGGSDGEFVETKVYVKKEK